jgi:hydrogenase maturation factor
VCLAIPGQIIQLSADGPPLAVVEVSIDVEARARLIGLTGNAQVPTLVEDGRVVAVGWHGQSCQV